MADNLREFIVEVSALRKNIKDSAATQLQSAVKRGHIQTLVDQYFRKLRPAVAHRGNSLLNQIDSQFQELLALSHTRGLVSKYVRLLTNIKTALVQLDTELVGASPNTDEGFTTTDERILSTLESLVPSAALSYKQALTDLTLPSRFSWRGPATDLREALRETLDYLAPDSDVIKGEGFKLEVNAHGPTMKQKVRYILKNRGISKTLSATPETAVEFVETAIGTFVRSVYTRSSVSTHTPTDKSEVLRIRDWVRITLCELLAIPT